jgi:hypothetical protein
MAEHIWTVACEKHLVDPASKIITLVGIAESFSQEDLEQRLEKALRLGKRGVLANHPLQLVSWWFRTDLAEEGLEVRFTLRNPAGETAFTNTAKVSWSEQVNVPARIFLDLDKFPVTMFGLHWFTVEYKKPTKNKAFRWVTVTKIPIGVEKFNATTEPEQPSEPTPSVPPASSSQL